MALATAAVVSAFAVGAFVFGGGETVTRSEINNVVDETYNYITKQSQNCETGTVQTNKITSGCKNTNISNVTQMNASTTAILCESDVDTKAYVDSAVTESVDALTETSKGLLPAMDDTTTETIVNMTNDFTQNIVKSWNESCRSNVLQGNLIEQTGTGDGDCTVTIDGTKQVNYAKASVQCLAQNSDVIQSRRQLEEHITATTKTKSSSLLAVIIIIVAIALVVGLFFFSYKGMSVLTNPATLLMVVSAVLMLVGIFFTALGVFGWWPFKSVDDYNDEKTNEKNKSRNRTMWITTGVLFGLAVAGVGLAYVFSRATA